MVGSDGPPRSRLERLARSLRRASIVLFAVFVFAALATIDWVEQEYAGSAPISRYVGAIADTAAFLVASVVAWVGAAVVEACGRVRASLLAAIDGLETARGTDGGSADGGITDGDRPGRVLR